MNDVKIFYDYNFEDNSCELRSGIYRFDIGPHFYIGSAVVFRRRWREHATKLKHLKHHSNFAQNAFNKYKTVIFSIVELCTNEELLDREQYWLDYLNPDLNMTKVVDRRWKLSEETIQKRTLKQQKQILQYSSDGVYIKTWDSVKEAGESLGISRSHISNCLKRKAKSAGGFIWAYSEDDFKDKQEDVLNKKSNGGKEIPIVQYTLEGEYIREWSGVREAKRVLNIKGNITQCCKGNRKTASGYIWKYKDEI